MIVDKITLKNYRNFESYEMTFGAQTTVLIGKNGTGKTNLISAIKKSLSFIFAARRDRQQYSFLDSSLQKITTFATTDARYGDIPNGGRDYLYPINIFVEASTGNPILTENNKLERDFKFNWEFHKENASEKLPSQSYRYIDANTIFWDKYSESKDIPVLAYFSDSYPHVLTNIGPKIKEMLNSGNPLPKNVAYYKWDEDKNCTEIWKQYFAIQYMRFLQTGGGKSDDFWYSVRKMLIDFSRCIESENNESFAIKEVHLHHTDKGLKIQIEFENGSVSFFDQLPQGYKRILSIVLDIASRSHLLNGNCNPQGVVIIDEVELHLHPSMAQEVLERLRKTFCRLQFIVSTHSPLVVTNFKQNDDNILYKLYRDEDSGDYQNCRMSDLYGVDYNSGLGFMDTPESDSYIQDLVSAYKYWKQKGDTTMIERLTNKLKKALGETNELYKSVISE